MLLTARKGGVMSKDPLLELVVEGRPKNTIATLRRIEKKPSPTSYQAGYQAGFKAGKRSRGDFHTLKRDKYAKMWVAANRWQVPEGIRRPMRLDTIDRAFVHGVFATLDMLRQDGLIPDRMLDKYWQQASNDAQIEKVDLL